MLILRLTSLLSNFKNIDILQFIGFFLRKKFSLYSSKFSDLIKISIFLNLDNKLVNLNMNNDFSLKSYKHLDLLKNSKKLDYNLDIS